MLPSWCSDIVTVLRAPMAPYRGTYERDWSRAESHTVSGCSFQPISTSTDRNDPRNASSVTAQLFAPPNSDIERGDRVQFDGLVFTVEGFALGWRSPFGGCDHMVCNLAEWSG